MFFNQHQSNHSLLVNLDSRIDCTSIAYSPDNSKVVVGTDKGFVYVVDTNTKQAIKRNIHSEMVECVAFSPDGSKVISGSRDKLIKVWSPHEQGIIATFTMNDDVLSLAFKPNELNTILSGSRDGKLSLWNIATKKKIAERSAFTDTKPVRSAFGRPYEAPSTVQGLPAIQSIAFNNDGSKIVAGSWNHTVKIIDGNDINRTILGPLTGHTSYIYSVIFSPDESKILSAGWDNTIRIWDSNSGRCIKTINVSQCYSDSGPHYVEQICLNSDGTLLAAGMYNNRVCIWNTQDWKLSKTLKIDEHVKTVSFSSDGSSLIAAGSKGKIFHWDVNTLFPQQSVINNQLSNTLTM